METNNKLIIGLGAMLLITITLFVGQYYDPTDDDRTLFIKYRHTFKQYFYSPVAYHRFLPTRLTATDEAEEKAFQDFIGRRKSITSDTGCLCLVALVLQLSLTLLVVGFYGQMRRIRIGYLQLFTHYLVNSFITFSGIVFILIVDNFIITSAVLLFIAVINISSIVFLTRMSPISKQNR